MSEPLCDGGKKSVLLRSETDGVNAELHLETAGKVPEDSAILQFLQELLIAVHCGISVVFLAAKSGSFHRKSFRRGCRLN